MDKNQKRHQLKKIYEWKINARKYVQYHMPLWICKLKQEGAIIHWLNFKIKTNKEKPVSIKC
jgi:chemotaxis receptor (MCP) glutamine deamidase CheD